MTSRTIPARARARLSTNTEPVVQAETIKAGVAALAACLVAFGIFVPSPAQVAAVIMLLTFVGGLLAKRARSKVTPVARADDQATSAWCEGWVKGNRSGRSDGSLRF
jgi:hypothetical protein